MDKHRSVVDALQKKWNTQILAAWISIATAIALVMSCIALQLFHANWIVVPVILIVVSIAVFYFFYRRIGQKDVVIFLNTTNPALEESTALLLKDPQGLSFLEKLQVQKIENSLEGSSEKPAAITRLVKLASVIIGISILLLFVLQVGISFNGKTKNDTVVQTRAEKILPSVKKLILSITPPAYTGKKSRMQDRFNIAAEESAIVNWRITTTPGLRKLQLIFNDKSLLHFTATDSSHTEWTARKSIIASGFYQVQVDSTLSEMYRLEMIKDGFPSIVVRSPKAATLIEAGHAQKTQLDVLLTDDYAIKNTIINATIASGNGEAVKFKKQQLLFADFSAGNKKYQLKKQIDLAALGMKAGDELYFYISATDSHDQEKKSDIYIVRIEDVTQLLSMEGLSSGLDIKPEFFRSQRQIIIETEQLLREKDTVAIERFNQRSANLGIDQQLLRLRYGKFLGEETNVEIGQDHDHDAGDHGGGATADQMMDAIAHKHDNTEDATFFDPETKKQLKAVLDEMWKSELQLRVLKPKDALPFEYKALKLLKELQQQTRAYVAKTGTKTPPLKLEKRLTGDLDKITQPADQKKLAIADEQLVLRKTLGLLEQLRNKEALSPDGLSTLESAGLQLGNKAADEPAVYLAAFDAYGRIVNRKYSDRDIALVSHALQQIIAASATIPVQRNISGDKKLSQQYFINLNRSND